MDSIIPPQFQSDSNQPQQPRPSWSQPEPVEEFDELEEVVLPEKEPHVEDPAVDFYGLSGNREDHHENIEEHHARIVEEHTVQETPEPFWLSEIKPEPIAEEPAPIESAPVPIQTPEPIAHPVVEQSASFEPSPDETEKVSYADSSIQEINISDIVANPYQPRTQFKQEALEELASSIREHGVIQPLVVTKAANGYEIVVGERRFRASQLAGLTKIPAIVKGSLHSQTKLEVALIENTQRQDLNAIEEARGYDRMIKEFNMTQDQVAKKVGKSRSAVANTLRLLNLPAEIQRGVIEGKITEGHARAILGLGDSIEKMILMYQTILDQGWNVRQVEAKVREITVKRRMDAALPDPKLLAVESELRSKLGAQVKVQRQGRGGKITIDFFSDEDLDEILNRMAEQEQNNSSDHNTYLTV